MRSAQVRPIGIWKHEFDKRNDLLLQYYGAVVLGQDVVEKEAEDLAKRHGQVGPAVATAKEVAVLGQRVCSLDERYNQTLARL